MRGITVQTAIAGVLILGGLAVEVNGKNWKDREGVYAIFSTNRGEFVCRLFEKEAPRTVENFIGLATGTKEFRDEERDRMVKRPFFNGLTFHRVIPDFMIQGGCPRGDGTGGPGYKFEDEFHRSLKHSKPGMLSMANSGPNTNGSQFFVTVKATPWLDKKHSIFGEVVDGMDVVYRIVGTKTGENDRPVEPVVVRRIIIRRVD